VSGTGTDDRAGRWAHTVLDALGEVERLGVADTVIAASADEAHDSASPRALVDGSAHGADSSREGATAFPTGAARYAIGPVLGQGGMGRVLSARDRQFGREVALKELTTQHEKSTTTCSPDVPFIFRGERRSRRLGHHTGRSGCRAPELGLRRPVLRPHDLEVDAAIARCVPERAVRPEALHPEALRVDALL